MNRTTFSIIGDRYLDTQHDAEYIGGLEMELEKRGITGCYRWFLEYLAASSFWWNIFWWDWVELNEKDVVIGWVYNIIIFGAVSALATYVFHSAVGICVFLLLHALTVRIGFGLRNGTKLNK